MKTLSDLITLESLPDILLKSAMNEMFAHIGFEILLFKNGLVLSYFRAGYRELEDQIFSVRLKKNWILLTFPQT